MVSVIFIEHVHNPELFLVLAGKFKGTFDLWIIIHNLCLYVLDDLKF